MQRKIKLASLILKNKTYNLLHPTKKQVALVSCNQWKNRVIDDLLLANELNHKGLRAKIIAWEDNTINYNKFGCAIVASMWGYQNDLVTLESWLNKMDEYGKLENTTSIIRNNYNKQTQFKILEKNKIATIQTQIVEQKNNNLVAKLTEIFNKFEVEQIVVKPAISGSGENTFLLKKDHLEDEHLVGRLNKINQEKALLVQPFISEIKDGELAVVMIDGKISHAIRRFPHIFNKSGKNHEVSSSELDSELITLCKKVSNISEYKNALYLRIDVVKIYGEYKIMEVEAFEPQLYYSLLKDRKGALDKMSSTIINRHFML